MESLSIILITILSLITLVASFLFVRALFPLKVEKIRANLENHWQRAFWLGLINTILITIIVIGLGSLGKNFPIINIPAFAIYSFFLIGLLFGLTAFNQILGERLFPDLDPLKRDIRSGAVLMLTSLLPAVGWFLLFPYVVCLGIGAVQITLFQKNSLSEPASNLKK